MKILFISEYFPPKTMGGGEISCYLLAKHLVKQGLEIHVLTSKFKNTKKEEIIEGMHIHRYAKTGENPSLIFSNIKRNIIFSKSIKKETKKLIKKYNFNIIHYFNINSMNGIIKTKIPKIAHINSPVLFCPKGDLLYNGQIECKKQCNYSTFNSCFTNSNNLGKQKNSIILKYNPLFKKYLYNSYKKRMKLLKKFDYFFPISNYLEKKLKTNNKGVIPNIVETDKFIKNNSVPDKLRIVYLGGYTKFKGIFILLNALKLLKKDFICDIYGEGELKNKIKINNSKINFYSNIDNAQIPKLLSKYNILIFPSLIPEAFGRVAIEAMAAGCLPIASKIGGIIDIIQEDKYLFTPGNHKELANILNKIDTKKINQKKLIEESKKYSGEKISKKVIKIYKKIK